MSNKNYDLLETLYKNSIQTPKTVSNIEPQKHIRPNNTFFNRIINKLEISPQS